MFLSRLFHKKNKKKWEEDVAKYEQARYATLETENSERTLHLTDLRMLQVMWWICASR